MMQKILKDSKGRTYYWEKGDLHTSLGMIKEKDIEEAKEELEDHRGNHFKVYTTNRNDRVERFKRTAQLILPKDAGMILAYTGIDKTAVVLDAGLGSAGLSSFIARFVKKVYAYEIKEEHRKTAEKNLESLEIKNIEIKNKDIYGGITEKNLDLITLDLAEPWKVLAHAFKALKPGAYLVSYVPQVTQMSLVCEEAIKQH